MLKLFEKRNVVIQKIQFVENKDSFIHTSKWLVFQKFRARRFGWAEELAPLQSEV